MDNCKVTKFVLLYKNLILGQLKSPVFSYYTQKNGNKNSFQMTVNSFIKCLSYEFQSIPSDLPEIILPGFL